VTQKTDWSAQEPGVTDFPGTDRSPQFDVDPDDPLAVLGQRLRHQLGRWHNLFRNRPTALTVDQHRWFMTLARVATTTVHRMIESASPDREQFHSHLEDLRANLLTVQKQIARRQLTWAHGTVTQLLDHHLRWVLKARDPSDPFPFPYQAFYRREQTLEPMDDRNSGATGAVRDFVRSTLSHFPHAELFGWEPDLLSRLHEAVPNLQTRDSSSAETLKELGSLSANEDVVRELLELHPDEQRLWQEAGHYHVIGDLVEQWRQWSGQYVRFGNPDSEDQQVLRGRFLRELWTTRVLINRVHVRLMTGLPAERAVSLLRIRFQHVTRWIKESRFAIEQLSDVSDIEWPQSGETQSEDPSSFQQQSIGGFPISDAEQESHTKNEEEPIWNHPSDSAVDRTTLETLNRLASTVKGTDSRSEYTNCLESHLNHLNKIEVRAMLSFCNRQVSGLPPEDARYVAGLTAHAGFRILNQTPFRDELLTREDELIDRSPPFDLLQDLLVTYFDEFAETEEPEVDDKLVPIYRELRERVVATRDRLGKDVPRSLDVKPLCRLVDLAGHYYASLATHLVYPHSFEELRAISRQRATVRVEQLGEELDQILDGIDHGITPPELRVVDENAQTSGPQ
jgi:hypothetical protein